MIIAQVLSILAFLISWVWWASFIISLASLVLLQLVWCCRQTREGLITTTAISILAAIMCIFGGAFVLTARNNAYTCQLFTLQNHYDDDDDWHGSSPSCYREAWAGIAFADAALWFATAACTILFVTTGRYAKWEKRLDKKAANNEGNEDGAEANATAVEMGNVQTARSATAEAPNAVTMATPIAVATNDGYVPPELLGKVYDAA